MVTDVAGQFVFVTANNNDEDNHFSFKALIKILFNKKKKKEITFHFTSRLTSEPYRRGKIVDQDKEQKCQRNTNDETVKTGVTFPNLQSNI